jgi:hypothetical protein
MSSRTSCFKRIALAHFEVVISRRRAWTALGDLM